MITENTIFFYNSLIDGDSVGIKKIYQILYPKVLKFILKNSGQKEDAEDVFQKALIELTARLRLKRLEIHTSFEAYFFSTCMNIWRRELNLKKRRVTNIPIVEHYDEHEDHILSILEQEKWDLYEEKFNLLSSNCKEVLKLYFSKTSYESIVKLLSYNSESVARQRVFKCRKKLSAFIKKDLRFKKFVNL
jgi:RNA polymerase sigma factor (sigma-70 family)